MLVAIRLGVGGVMPRRLHEEQRQTRCEQREECHPFDMIEPRRPTSGGLRI